jgi:ABC-type spermidine/putrescine transport system permease subunit II
MRIVLPEVVAAVGLFLLFRRLNVPLGMWTIAAGHVVFNSAYATIIIQARVATLNTTLEEAAADLGAVPWRAFRRVTVPLLRPAIIVAGLLIFTFSFDDVVTSAFLSGDAVTLPVLIFGLMRFHVTPEVNAIGSGVMLITLVTFALATALVGLRAGTSTLVGARTADGTR